MGSSDSWEGVIIRDDRTRFFWEVYKNLEEDVMSLPKYIHFSSDQKGVYSIRIADLILKCAIEIEAISKKIYQGLGGNMSPTNKSGNIRTLHFDDDCLDLIENTYRLSEKEIILSATSFDFDEADRIITPLKDANKCGRKGCKWKQAYQALKHDRYTSLKSEATIENLLNAIGALYILNLYFRDKVYPLKRDFTSFDARVDSQIFSVYTYDATRFSVSPEHMDDSCISTKNAGNISHAIYIIKCTDKCFSELYEALREDNDEMYQRIINNPEVIKYLSAHPEDLSTPLPELFRKGLDQNILRSIISLKHFESSSRNKEYEAVINHGKNIYPTLSNT